MTARRLARVASLTSARTSAFVALLSGCGAGAQTPTARPAPTAEQPPPPQKKPPLARDVVVRSALPLSGLRPSTGTGGEGEQELEEAALWETLGAATVICFGEQHDSPRSHFAQLRALEELAQRATAGERQLAVGFEMFQRPFQAALSGYVAGTLTESEFLEQSEYSKRWGFDFSLYRPLLDRARESRLAPLALNAPKELSRAVARQGLSGLDETQKAELPELLLDDPAHRGYFDAAMGGHPMPEGAPTLDNMYAAQVLWDETMAETAASWLLSAEPGALLIVFAGAGHCHRSAIPARITRRTGGKVLAVNSVLASELKDDEQQSVYDLLVILND